MYSIRNAPQSVFLIREMIEMRESRTPRTTIIDLLWTRLEVVKDSQKAMRYSSLFVSIRLKSLALLP